MASPTLHGTFDELPGGGGGDHTSFVVTRPAALAGVYVFDNGIWAKVSGGGGDPTLGGDLQGVASAATIRAGVVDGNKIAATLKPSGGAAAGTESLRALGVSASTAAAGNDGRLSDARTPTGHAASHKHGGGDEVASAASAANAIPKAGAGGQIAIGFLASGAPDGTKFVRDDGTLAVPPGGSAAQVQPTYLIYKTGANFAAKAAVQSGLADVGANADAAVVFNTCLDNINSATTPRGSIVFAGNTVFTWNTTPSIRRTYSGPFTRAGTTTNTSPTVTGLATTVDLSPGMSISGTGIPVNTLILTVDSGTQITLTKNATATGSPTLSFYNGPDDEKWLRILGSGGSVIQFGTATRFLDFKSVANYDGFCGIEIGNLEIDCNNVVGVSNNHTLIGTQVAGSATLDRTDFRRLWIHDVSLYRLPTGGSGGTQRCGIWIECSHTNPGGATTPEAIRNYITDITIERYRQLGGAGGILVAGNVPGHADYMAVNIFGDRWRLSDFYIDSLVRDQTAIAVGGGLQFGGSMAGESMVIERGETHCFEDDNEFNDFRQILVRDVHAYDFGQAAFFACNFGYVNGLDASEQESQRIIFENCHYHTTNAKANGTYPSRGFGLNTVGNADMGTIIYRNCSATHHVMQPNANYSQGFFFASGTGYKVNRLIFDDFKAFSWYDATGIGLTECFSMFFYVGVLQSLTMRNIDVTIKGDRKQASGQVCFWRPLYISGCAPNMRLDIDGFVFRDETTNAGSLGWTQPICLGREGGVLSGHIRGLYHAPSPGDTWPWGVYAYGTNTVKKLVIAELDGSQLANYTPYQGDATNAPAVQLRNIKGPSLALPEVAFTPGATTVAAQYLGGYSGLMTVTGGTVTVVSVSTDNVTYRQVAAGTNTSFRIDNGMWVKLTYTVVPACNVIPDR